MVVVLVEVGRVAALEGEGNRVVVLEMQRIDAHLLDDARPAELDESPVELVHHGTLEVEHTVGGLATNACSLPPITHIQSAWPLEHVARYAVVGAAARHDEASTTRCIDADNIH